MSKYNKYINNFANEAEYETYINGSVAEVPNTALIDDTGKMIYAKILPNNYVMFGTLERKRKLSALYAAVFNKKSHMLNGCGACALRECKELGTVYFKEEEIREQKKAEEQTVTEEVKPKKTIRNTKKGKGE